MAPRYFQASGMRKRATASRLNTLALVVVFMATHFGAPLYVLRNELTR